MDEKKLAEIKARCEAANEDINILYHNNKVGAKTYGRLCAAYDDIPELLDDVERLRNGKGERETGEEGEKE